MMTAWPSARHKDQDSVISQQMVLTPMASVIQRAWKLARLRQTPGAAAAMAPAAMPRTNGSRIAAGSIISLTVAWAGPIKRRS